MAMNRAQFKKQLQDGLNTVVGLELKKIKENWRQYLDVETESKKAYVEDVVMPGFEGASVKAEGAGVGYRTTSEIYTARYIFETVAIAFAITEEAEEDVLYGSIGKRLARAASRAMMHTKAIKCADILNNGFDSNYPGGDGVELFSTAHLSGGGAAANELTTPADLSETSLEDLLILIDDAEDYRGVPMPMDALRLIVPTALRFTAHRILHSQLQNDTAENAINAIKDSGTLSGGYVVDRYLTDPDAWFVKTDAMDGLKHIVRKTMSQRIEGDFESGNMRYRLRERYINGHTDWHGAYGSAGGGA